MNAAPGHVPPDDLFSPGGLAVWLTGPAFARQGGGREEPPTVTVQIGGQGVTLTADDLTCPQCGAAMNPPRFRPARWLATNRILNAGQCLDCSARTTSRRAYLRRHGAPLASP